VSNGFHKFHLAFAAECLAEANRLSCLLTAIYPTAPVKRLVKSLGLDRQPPLRRLLDREVNVPRCLIRSYWLGEIAEHMGAIAQSYALTRSREFFSCMGMRAYAARAVADVKRLAPSSAVYHYRSGFGGPSVAVAKKQGLVALCDHSIAHPRLVDWLSGGGNEDEGPASGVISEFWRLILDDIEQADHVVVNSDFVKHTFQLAGADTSNVHVIYLGVDDEFARVLTIEDIAAVRANRPDATPSILFAGGFDQRKAFKVIDALQRIWDLNWRFSIAGTVEPEIAKAHPDFFASCRVRQLGWIPRGELARVMATSDIFLFPSRAEGSARVVFEALASGCFVITTRNSGSIVADGRHGSIVPPCDGAAIGRALAETLANIGDARRIGMQNAALVRSEFTQLHYGRSLEKLYDRIVPERS
jgi:glycosyltransferase involved in cell wall biosynthesis